MAAKDSAGESQPLRAHLRPLTGSRFFAALLVIMFHYGRIHVSYAHASSPLSMLNAAASSIVSFGNVGVGFFFVLSGFILAHTYINSSGTLRGGQRSFLLARFARIYPVYLLAFVITAVPIFVYCYQHRIAPPFELALADLTLVQSWLPSAAIAWNAPAWSLSAEAFFYLLFPLCALLIARLTPRQLIIATMSFYGAILASPLAFLVFHPHGSHWIEILAYLPLVRLPEFLLGICFARLYDCSLGQNTRNLLLRFACSGWLAGCALLATVTLLAVGGSWLPVMTDSGLLDILFGALVFSLAWNEGRIAAFLSLPGIVLLGEASYALYILQSPVWNGLSRWTSGRLMLSSPSLAYFCIYLCLMIGIAVLSLRLIETPSRRAIRRLFLAA